MGKNAQRRRSVGQAAAHQAARSLAQPYVQAIERARASGMLALAPGTVAVLEVRHDDDCPKLRGGLCRCAPDLALRPLPAKEVDA